MKDLAETATGELLWEKPDAWKREFFLKDGESVLANLRWLKGWGSLAQAETAEGAWTFKRGGFFKTFITVRPLGSETDIGQVDRKWNGRATFNLFGGPGFIWDKNKDWRGSWGFYDLSGRLLCSLKLKSSFGKHKGTVRLEPGTERIPEITLLVLLGWYLEWLRYEESSATAATIVATS